MIGNVASLINFTTTKDNYTLYIPLFFWFCNNSGLSLPINALEFSDVKINIEFANINDVLLLEPTHYIDIENNIVQFETGNILYQNINGNKNYIKFCYFENRDDNIHRLYYSKINSDAIKGYTDVNNKNTYNISSLDGLYRVYTKLNSIEMQHINKQINFDWVASLSISTAYLLVDYIYLDIDERVKFIKSNHEYLIDVLIYDNDRTISNNSSKIKLGYCHPCKELIFRAQMDYLVANNVLLKSNYSLDYFQTKDIINNIQIIMNGTPRLSSRSSNYFHLIQPFQHHSNNPPNGIYCYSFALHPEDQRPTGTCNLSKIDDLQIAITVDKAINYSNQAKIRVYGLCINVLRILDGQGGLAFLN